MIFVYTIYVYKFRFIATILLCLLIWVDDSTVSSEPSDGSNGGSDSTIGGKTRKRYKQLNTTEIYSLTRILLVNILRTRLLTTLAFS